MQETNIYPKGLAELRAMRRQSRHLFGAVFVFSIFVNLLMLAGPLYMLQVYDRVLSSRSVETLTALTLLVLGLFAMMGLLDWARGRVLARVGARFQAGLDQRVFYAMLDTAKHPHFRDKSINGMNDLTTLQMLYASPALLALFDMPWAPIFIAAIFVFHPLLGWLALASGVFLVILTLVNQRNTRENTLGAQQARATTDHFAAQIREEADTVTGLGMRGDVLRRWKSQSDDAMARSINASDATGFYASLSKSFRMFVQSAMLGLGALLTLRGELSGGAMIAGSIMLGRALAPIEMGIGQWPLIQKSRAAWRNLSELLQAAPLEPARVSLPVPEARIEAQNLSAVPPGSRTPCLRGVGFVVEPGQALGVIGQSASGKSSLARLIAGVWPVAAGHLRLGGATLDQYDADVLGQYIGYLPQNVTLFGATIAENIARMAETPDEAKVVAAAKRAGAHELILEQSDGYNTVVTPQGGALSGGQIQRIGLARALYGNPLVLILDEPNSALDAVGSASLNAAIRQMKSENKSVIIMAHRPSGIAACDTLLVLENGIAKMFGPRDDVLKAQVKNTEQIQQSLAEGGRP
ncbi:protease/lipase ABC transporter permease/ATP-binding protein [Amylibacter marinus]|uniref:Protease/lipase ABC transporter permease/ATP-binding protein n=1 Tax=Amylibacter marinus TaxID=1475483 RepID=A0ABQ5VWW1_9RHOB|nr:type I secretion system permease/ATPase [Amylibacter marinus]GLQ35687.1 protease/lipase ABC transporter permease/ATP-binding protein [Amylibacter marinus]